MAQFLFSLVGAYLPAAFQDSPIPTDYWPDELRFPQGLEKENLTRGGCPEGSLLTRPHSHTSCSIRLKFWDGTYNEGRLANGPASELSFS